MQTIVFYSFKGGTGRTTAIAQLAMLLKEYGHRVVAMDFDLGAPGLWDKLSRPLGLRGSPNYGVVEYMEQHRNGPIQLQALRTAASVSSGVLNLLPAGDPFANDDTYWQKYLSPVFQTFIATDVASDQLIVSIKKKIVEEYSPEYLLIDAPSGVSRLAAMAIELLADTAVLLSARHNEGLLGLNFILRKLQDARAAGVERVPDVKCVLTRVPYELRNVLGAPVEIPEEKLDQIRTDALQIINRDLKDEIHDLFMFRSEPRMELEDVLPMQVRELDGSLLVSDYISFFSHLIQPLAKPLSLRSGPQKRSRAFTLLADEGRMLNPADNSPNVALRVDTLVSTFTAIAASVSDSSGGLVAQEVLERAGWTAADKFSRYLTDRWKEIETTRQRRLEVVEKLEQWCEFDSTVGFGKFGFNTWGDGTQGEIYLDNNFLVADRGSVSGQENGESGVEKDSPSLCGLMSGYIRRVVEAVFQRVDLKVTHEDKDCAKYKDGDARCVFRFGADSN